METNKDNKMPSTNQSVKLDPKKSKEETASTKDVEKSKNNSIKEKKGCC